MSLDTGALTVAAEGREPGAQGPTPMVQSRKRKTRRAKHET